MIMKDTGIQIIHFMMRRAYALECTNPVPTKFQKRGADLITRAQFYEESVRFVDGNQKMEATVASIAYGALSRYVKLFESTQKIPY